MDLTIITVTYRSVKYIDSCILSIVTHLFKSSYEHIIVDNASDDGTVECIESGYLNHVRLIKNSRNLGFAAANNIALQCAKGRYILFFNPDMQIERGSLDDLLAWADTVPDLGIATCQLIDHTGHPHAMLRPVRLPLLKHYIASFFRCRPFISSVMPHLSYPFFDDHQIQEVEQVRGAFMLIPKHRLDTLGYGFDPMYFILFEDVDLCKQMQVDGYKVLYNPMVGCIDFCSRSFFECCPAWKYCHAVKSLKTYVKKWHSSWHLMWLNVFIGIGFVMRMRSWGLRKSVQSLIQVVFLKQ